MEKMARSHHIDTGALPRPYCEANAAINFTAIRRHLAAWQALNMMYQHDLELHGEVIAMANASQDGHTAAYAQAVL